jgi:transcriptional regulator with XRE-family HTH domain
MSIRKIIGNNMKALRSAKEWSQEKLAFRSKLSVNYVSALERGVVNVSADSLEKIAKSLDVEVEDLVKKPKIS